MLIVWIYGNFYLNRIVNCNNDKYNEYETIQQKEQHDAIELVHVNEKRKRKLLKYLAK
jgi:hypothetical protein